MVKFLFFLILISAVFAGEFTASVSNKEVQLNEELTLTLILKGSSPKDSPSFAALKKDFIIQSQQNSSSTSIINGNVTSSMTWNLTLTPKVEGKVEIPSISIDTAEGKLSTAPILLNIVKGSGKTAHDNSHGLNIVTKASQYSPYKNEPILYTAVLTSKAPLYNVQSEKMEVKDALVELLEEPKLEEKVIEGVRQNVVEYSYLITPMKPGALTIPSVAIQVAIPQKRKGPMRSFFQDDFNIRPFTLMTEEVQLDVQPAVPGISPWLPAKSLTLEEIWPSDQTLRVGEPISRGFLMTAEGTKASQLPHLEDLQGSSFKVYADKPEDQEKIVHGNILSARKEQLTLIPQHAGPLQLPEISIHWWDTVKREKRTTTLPARAVEILPSVTAAPSAPLETPSASPLDAPLPKETPYLLYSIIGAQTFLLAALLLWVLILQRKIASLTQGTAPQKTEAPVIKKLPLPEEQKEKKEKLPDLNPT